MSNIGYKLGLLVSKNPKFIASAILAFSFMIGAKLIFNYFNELEIEKQKIAEKEEVIKLEKLKELNEMKALQSISPFGELFLSSYNKISSANKFDRYEVFKNFKNSVCRLPQEFKNWPLTVSWAKASNYGGHYALVGFESITHRDIEINLNMTGRGAASDDPLFEDGYNDLSRGSYLYNKIKTFENGDKVLVSGKLMPGMGCNIETGIADENWLYAGNFYLHFYIKEINKI